MTTGLRVGIDGRTLEGKKTGIGIYVFELCKALSQWMPGAEFFVYSQTEFERPVDSPSWHYRRDVFPLASRMRPIPWLKLREGTLARQDRLDVFWAGGSLLPRLKTLPSVLSVYDLNHLITPQTMSRLHLLAHNAFLERDLLRATRVISISAGTSERCLDHFGRPADDVILPGLAPHFRPTTPAEVSSYCENIGLNRPYILSVATWEPRKNLETLIRAFLDLKKRGEIPNLRLALVGGTGWKDDALNRLIAESDRDTVVPLGYIPNTELAPLYTGTDLFVFPSVYEGFGMPILEARACGAPVLTSETPETREAGGEHAVYVTPSVEGIAKGILAGLEGDSRTPLDDDERPTWDHGARILARELQRAASCPV